MKKITSLLIGAMALCGASASAQIMIDWNEEGQFTFYPEDFVCEGGVMYDEDEAAFVFDGTEEGRIYLNLDGKTIDMSQVANIEVKGSFFNSDNDAEGTFGPGAWGGDDPIATLFIGYTENDEVVAINEWWGSRYAINFKDFASKAGKVSTFYFKGRAITETEGEGDDAVTTVLGYVPGFIYLDEVVFTKSVEKDPMAIDDEMFYEWDNWDATAQPIQLCPCDYNIGKALGGGAVVYGTGSVLGKQFANLTEYAGIYAKGTPGLSIRLLFNRPDMEGGSAPISECNPVFDENGEMYFYFTELAEVEIGKFGEAYPYVHLNTVKMPWGLPEGVESAKVTLFNYIEATGIENVISTSVKDNKMYNLQGVEVNASYKGLVIKNGVKFFNK